MAACGCDDKPRTKDLKVEDLYAVLQVKNHDHGDYQVVRVMVKNMTNLNLTVYDKVTSERFSLDNPEKNLIVVAIDENMQSHLTCSRPGFVLSQSDYSIDFKSRDSIEFDLLPVAGTSTINLKELLLEHFCLTNSNKNYLQVQIVQLIKPQTENSYFEKMYKTGDFQILHKSNLIEIK